MAAGLFFGLPPRVKNIDTWAPSALFDFPGAATSYFGPWYDKVQNRLYFWDDNPRNLVWFNDPAGIGYKFTDFTVSSTDYGFVPVPSANRIFICSPDTIDVINTVSMTRIATWTVPTFTGIFAVDEGGQRLFLRTGTGSPYTITIVDLLTGATLGTATDPGAGSAAASGFYFHHATSKIFRFGPGVTNPNFRTVNVQNGIDVYDSNVNFLRKIGTGMPSSWGIVDPNGGSGMVYSPVTDKFYMPGVQKIDDFTNLEGLIELDPVTEAFNFLPFGWNASQDTNLHVQAISGLVVDETTGTIYVGGSDATISPFVQLPGALRSITPAVPFSASTWVDHTDPTPSPNGLVLAPFTLFTLSPAPTAVAISDTEVLVTWLGTSLTGNPNASYIITSNTGVSNTVAAPATSFVFSGLTTGVAYTFTVSVVDTTGATTLPSAPSNSARPIGTVGPSTTALYGADGTSVTVYAKNGNKFAGINLELDPAKPYLSPSAVVHDSTHNRVYVFNSDGDVHWYDIATKAHQSATIGVNPQTVGQQFVAFDSVTNKIFLATASVGGGVPVFDTATNTLLSPLSTGSDSVAYIYADEVHRRLWVMSQITPGNNTVRIFNLDTLALVNTLTGYPDAGVFGWCADPSSPRVFTLQASVNAGLTSPGIDVRSALDGSITRSFSVYISPDFVYINDFAGGSIVGSGAHIITYSAATNNIYGVGTAPNDSIQILVVMNPDTLVSSYVPFFSDGNVLVDDVTGSLYSCLSGAPSVFRSFVDPHNGPVSVTE